MMRDSSIREYREFSSVFGFLEDILTKEEYEMILDPYNKKAKDFVSKVLGQEERSIIRSGARDEIIIAIIERMRREDCERLKMFDRFIPKREYRRNYMFIQRQWLLTEYHLLGNPEDSRVVIEDSKKHCNAERFRAFYTIKYPERMERGYKLEDLKK